MGFAQIGRKIECVLRGRLCFGQPGGRVIEVETNRGRDLRATPSNKPGQNCRPAKLLRQSRRRAFSSVSFAFGAIGIGID